MNARRPRLRPPARLSLTQQVALLSLLPVIALGWLLAHVLQQQLVSRAVEDASRSAQLVARLGIQPRLTPAELRSGLSPEGVRELDQQLSARSSVRDLARIKIWNAHDTIVYSDDHRLIGRALEPSDELENALAGRPNDATVVDPKPRSETADEVGLGRLLEVYVPLRFTRSARPAGAFEMYLSYRPIAAAIAGSKRTIALLVAIGLALLWAVLFRIVARASRRLRRSAAENYRLAHYDPLTGLPNRTLFIERLGAALRRPRTGTRRPAVLLLDLESFKEINNALGSSTGDHVLREVARRLVEAGAGEALVARLGGDEYALLCPAAEGVPGALALAAAVHGRLDEPIELDGTALNVEGSIGIALCDDHGERGDTLLRGADAALARAKALHARVEVYSPTRDSFDPERLRLLGEARAALERHEFVLHYQPKLDLRNEEVAGVEALLRWRHPERGLLAPMTFIPLIEQTALIGPLTVEVISLALRALVRWSEQGLELGMSVNLSARSLLDPDLPGLVAGRLRWHGISPSRLTIEVTESAAMADPERAADVLRGLRDAGVGVSIDDFGTGNASIAYLARLPASEVKIDRSLVTDMCEDPRAGAIVRATIDLARLLDLNVVAEGVETPAVLERLREIGCASAQGYLIARPLPEEELAAFVKGRQARSRVREQSDPRPAAGRRAASTRSRRPRAPMRVDGARS